MKTNENEAILTHSFYLSAAECNAQQEMSLPLLAQKLIDVATEHANILGIGNPNMPNPDMGWVLSRLTVEMNRYPHENTNYSITTWVEDWNRHFSRRAFSIADEEGNIMGYARSIWMVLNTSDRSNAGLTGLNFKPEWISNMECPIPMQEKHVRIEPDDNSPVYRFKYCDIDFYRHVNTVRYIDLLLNQFDMQDYDENIIKRLELSFLHEASYGMEIRIMKQTSETNALLHRLYLEKSDASMPILYSRLRFVPRS